MILLDFTDWTATLLQGFASRDHIESPSQGNVQLLQQPQDDDHVFIGRGASAAFTEHDLDGNLLCETHFGASWFFWFERVKSYRAFKTFDWRAIPAGWDPQARIDKDRMYVSWNGATEVAFWKLQSWDGAANVTQDSWFPEQQILKGETFEYSFLLLETVGPRTYRIAALDANHDVLRYSNEVVYEPASSKSWVQAIWISGVFVLGVCGLLYLWRSAFFKTLNTRDYDKEGFKYHALGAYEHA